MHISTLRAPALLLLPLAFAGCLPMPKPVVTFPALADTLGPAWTMVPLPNTRLTPGAIVQINPLDAPTLDTAKAVDLVWLGTLADCAVPEKILAITAGAVPGIQTGSSYDFNADLGAKLAQVTLDAGANASGTASMKIDDSSDSSLNYISFTNWVAQPRHARNFDRACGKLLHRPSVFVIQESFIVAHGSYSFNRAAGGKIAVTPPPNVPVKAEIDGKGGTTGDLTITAPIVFALKTMQALPEGGFRVASIRVSSVRHAAHRVGSHAVPPPPQASPSPLQGKSLTAIRQLPGS